MKNIVIKNSMKNQKSLGCWMPFTSVQLIELLAIAGFDFVQLDGEHGPFDLNQIYSNSIKTGWLTTGPEVKNFE